jgi:hypothetical protein
LRRRATKPAPSKALPNIQNSSGAAPSADAPASRSDTETGAIAPLLTGAALAPVLWAVVLAGWTERSMGWAPSPMALRSSTEASRAAPAQPAVTAGCCAHSALPAPPWDANTLAAAGDARPHTSTHGVKKRPTHPMNTPHRLQCKMFLVIPGPDGARFIFHVDDGFLSITPVRLCRPRLHSSVKLQRRKSRCPLARGPSSVWRGYR